MTTASAPAVRDQAVEVWDGRLRLHVKVAGDGPPLLYFHPLSGLTWNPLLSQLATRHTVYAPEHPGTSPGDPQAISQVQTFWELLLVYDELIRGLGLDRPGRVAVRVGEQVLRHVLGRSRHHRHERDRRVVAPQAGR